MIVKQGITQSKASYNTQKTGPAMLSILGGMVIGGLIVTCFVAPPVAGAIAPFVGKVCIGVFIGGSLVASAFEPVYGSDFNNSGNQSPEPHDPIIFDLNNDGILETTDINNGIYFDHENDGFAESSAWVGNNDGVLVIDNNSNEKIDNGTELLTAETLASFNTNEDGIIDENDTNFSNLKILKGDGTLMTLTEAGITSINLNTTSTEITDENGNQQFASGIFTRADGTTGTFGEFLVKTETSNSIATEWLDETDEISDLPDISGSGNIYSLHQAMLRDESGELQELIEDFVSETNDSIRKQIVEQILIKWTGTENIPDDSRGENVNAKHLAILEKIMGRNFWSTYDAENYDENTNPANPNLGAGQILETAYEKLKTSIYAELMSKTHLLNLFDIIIMEYESYNEEFQLYVDIHFDFKLVTNYLINAIAENAETGKALAIQFVTTLKGLGLDSCSNYFDPFDDNCLYTALTKNDRELKWQFDTIGKISIEDKTGEGEGSGADDIFRGEQDEDSHFHALTGDDTIYGENGNDSFYACNGDDLVDGGDGDDEIFAGEGNDIVFGGAGNDQLYGAWGDDTIFGGDGDDTIYPDQVDNVNGYGASEGNDIIRGDKGNDTIYSDLGDDTFIFNLGDGQDTVYEKQGVDTFYFGNGIAWSDLTFEQSGDDIIIKINNTSDQITVKDWFLTTGENYKYDNNKIEIFEFADGSKHYKDEITTGDNTESIIYNMDETEFGYLETANDYKTTVNLKSGWNHIVAGENSNDTYVFAEQGTDALIVNYSGNNTIKFGNGITLENTVFERSEDGLNISFNDFDGHISIEGDIGTFANFEFADGTVITDIKNYLRSDIAETDYEMGTNTEELTLVGYEDISATGNDLDNTIRGNEGNTTFEGKGGNDYYESTLGGDDTYIFNLGDGYDTIHDIGGLDTIKFGEGITLENIVMLRNLSSNNLEIWFDIEDSNCGITIENYFGNDENKIERFEFADGTVITDITDLVKLFGSEDDDITLPENIEEAHLRGQEDISAVGNDLDNWMGGNSGDNTFTGGKGNDDFWDDQNSSERYIYNLGDGHDTIEDYGGVDAIIFGDNITKDNIFFSQDENNLVISFSDNEDDSICIINYFADIENRIELFRFANGDVISDISAYLQNESGEVAEIVSDGSIVLIGEEETATLSGTNNATVLGNNLNNTIVGNSGNNTYYAGGGDDTITDILGGNDTYIYKSDNGNDVITDVGGLDTLKFVGDITLANTKFEQVDNNIVISFYDFDGSVTITDYFLDADHKIENIIFSDGETIDLVDGLLTGIVTNSNYTFEEETNVDTVHLIGSENLTVTGNSANNTILGNTGNTTFDGKGGDDTFISEKGRNDTYIYNLGDGFDYIKDVGGNDTIKFGEGITLDNLAFKQTATNLEIWFQFEEGGLVIENFFSNPDNKIERFELADGTVITDISNYITAIGSDGDIVLPSGVQQALLSGSNDATITGNNLDNWLSGNSGNNTFNGGQGNDFIVDESDSDDTYIYNLGDGYDTIHDHGGFDKIKFGAGITKENLVFVRQTDGNLIINFVNENGEFLDGNICIKDYFNNEDNKIEKIEFADGSSIVNFESKVTVLAGEGDISNWYNLKEVQVWSDGDCNVYGSQKDEVIFGGAGNNTYDTYDGTDYIYDTQGGNDEYIFGDNSDIKYILDIGGEDTIKIGSFTSFEETMFVQNGNNLRIYFKNKLGKFIQIEDYFVDDEHKIEKCEFADGTVITDLSNYITGYAKEDDITLSGNNKSAILLGKDDLSVIGSSNDDYIRGNSGDNTYTGGAGDDKIEDRAGGNDTYVYNWGDGNDCIMDIGGEDTIRFGESITLGNLSFENCNGDLKIEIRNEDGDYGSIFVVNHFKSDYRKIEHFEFADGTIIDDITPYLAGITIKSDYTIAEDNTNLKNIYMKGKKDISVVGNSADNHFEGNSGNNTFEGKGGNDNYWDEAGGDDTYIYNLGDGYDFLHDKFGNDTIQFGAGITENNIKFIKHENNLEIRVNTEENKGNIWIDNYFESSDDYKIENIKFADGTVITNVSDKLKGLYSETENVVLSENMIEGGVSGELNLNVTGNNLDNYLNGNAGDNVLTGGQGDDHFYDEEGGNDTYIYNLGDGNDYICDVNGNDTIQFGAGITSDNIMFLETSDGHLEIRFQGSEGSIVIEDYFNNEIDHKIENIKFSDGTTLTDISSLIVPYTEETDGYAEENTVINRLIQEMSSYAPEGEMANGEYNQNNDELLQLVAC